MSNTSATAFGPSTANNVLIVTYAFPPTASVGVHRWLSLSKFLPRYGCNTWVLAPRNAVAPMYDQALLQRVGKEVKVVRAFTPEMPYKFRKLLWNLVSREQEEASSAPTASATVAPAARGGLIGALKGLAKRLTTPDPQAVWIPFARRKARRLIRRRRIDTVIFTGPPYSPLLMVPTLRKDFPKLKILLDFRDEWIDFYLGHIELTAEKKENLELCRGIERRAVEAADLITAVTETQAATIRARYPNEPAAKFRSLPNGYDPDVFRPLPERARDGDIAVTSVGTIYPMSFPDTFFDAVEMLPAETKARIHPRFIGRVTPECSGLIAQHAHTRADFLGFMPQEKAYEFVRESDILLTIVRDTTSHGGKFFEYLATRKPILALTPHEGELGQLMHQTGAGWCVDPDNPAAIRDALLNAEHGRPPRNEDEIAKYDRSRQAGLVAQWIRELSEAK